MQFKCGNANPLYFGALFRTVYTEIECTIIKNGIYLAYLVYGWVDSLPPGDEGSSHHDWEIKKPAS